MLAALVAAALAYPAWAMACACCANRGDYSERTGPILAFERDELVRLRFGPVANLRQTPAFPDDVRGISPLENRWRVSQFRRGLIFQLTLRDARGNKGTLSFVLPRHATRLHVDPQDGRVSGAGGPLLYKEWRLDGTLHTSGIFKGSGKPRFRLVLQGRGNQCVNVRDFRAWILQVSGPTASFQLYGTFRSPAP